MLLGEYIVDCTLLF